MMEMVNALYLIDLKKAEADTRSSFQKMRLKVFLF